MNEITAGLKKNLEEILGFLRENLAKIRTGRASPAVIEDLVVDAYGEKLKLKELAAIRAPKPRELRIEPWDRNILEEIEKALSREDLGALPVAEENAIRITFPPLTSERRAVLITEVGKQVEVAKSQVRYARQKARGQAGECEKTRGEDFVFGLKKEIDGEVEKVGEEIEEIKRRKEEEIGK